MRCTCRPRASDEQMVDVTPSIANTLQLEILQQVSSLGIALGNLQGQANIIIREQERAAEGRRLMYEKLNRIDTLAQIVERITPLVDAHEKKHNQAAGMMLLGRTLWAASAGAIGAGATLAAQWLMGKPPHP